MPRFNHPEGRIITPARPRTDADTRRTPLRPYIPLMAYFLHLIVALAVAVGIGLSLAFDARRAEEDDPP